MDFDVIPYEDIAWGEKLGSGSFGSVFKGNYLGIDIAIKEVLPSTEYDVHKYFEREWRIMRECRHPNIVLFLGLSKAVDGDGRVFIVSEFVPRGNLRQFILSSHSFPWRLRLSFATDVARAVAYLHARQVGHSMDHTDNQCIHRDLKGENLLITSNERIKVTDFGFARIASRNADEMRRMTYCGTDGYMSPEIINGFEFDLPTDVFSLGIIFTEILSRRLVDSKTFIRQAPSFVPDQAEVRRRASKGCPPAFVELALHCCLEDPAARPKMPEVLARLREIELDVLSRLDNETEHVGSIRILQHTGKRAMPIFEPVKETTAAQREDEGEASDKRMEEDALEALAKLQVDGKGAAEPGEGDTKDTWRTARWEEQPSVITQWSDASEMRGHHRLLPSDQTSSSFEAGPPHDYDSSFMQNVGNASAIQNAIPPDDTTSTMTIKASPSGTSLPALDSTPEEPIPKATATEAAPPSTESEAPAVPEKIKTKADRADEEAAKQAQPPAHGTHRFTLIEKEALTLLSGKKPSTFPSTFAAFLPKALAPSNKCPVCHKRIGQRPALQCDDCSVFVHVKCSHAAARDCTGEEAGARVTAERKA